MFLSQIEEKMIARKENIYQYLRMKKYNNIHKCKVAFSKHD